MGLDIVALSFLLWNRDLHGPLGRTIMLGRQELHVPEANVRSMVGITGAYRYDQYCEALLADHFGATSIESLDFSDYESATILHDLNLPLPERHRGQFDAVIDFGTLEHVFDVAQALRNCAALLRPGGQVLHVVPGNNLCGHGFWQFSPEAFLSFYTDRNGFRDTRVFTADVYSPWRLTPISFGREGERMLVDTTEPTYMVARSTLGDSHVRDAPVQQSDYLHVWRVAQDGQE